LGYYFPERSFLVISRFIVMHSSKILLIISCGKKKSEELKFRALKAKEAYQGPMFQVINKAKREDRWPRNLELGIISAKYGLLRSDDEIKNYDLKMTKAIAEKLNPEVIRKIRKWSEEESFSLIHIIMGKDYLESVRGVEDSIQTEVKIENMGGLGIGQRKLVNFINSVNIPRL
jgi:hypothetical protein